MLATANTLSDKHNFSFSCLYFLKRYFNTRFIVQVHTFLLLLAVKTSFTWHTMRKEQQFKLQKETIGNAGLTALTVDEIFSVIPDLLFVVDRNTVILEYRAGNSSDLYLPPEEFLGKSMCQVLPNDISSLFKHTIENAFKSRKIETIEYQLPVNGNPKWFEARACCSDETRCVIFVRDISELKSHQADLLYQANHDSLTGVHNRAFAIEFLSQKITEAQRKNTHTAVFFIDLDDFKIINDDYGHEAGDNALIEVSRAIKRAIRKQDLVARFGGDEFMVIIDGASELTDLLGIANKIITEVSSHNIAVGVPLSVSIGIACCEKGSLLASELIRRADIAMYNSKHQGKNCATFFEQEMTRK